MNSGYDDPEAFALLENALRSGFPIRPKDILGGRKWPQREITQIIRRFAKAGKAVYTTRGSTYWLVPIDAKMDVEEFNFIQYPKFLSALSFAFSNRIFTQQDMYQAISSKEERAIDAEVRKTAARLWHLDLVIHRGTEGDQKYFTITPRGRKLYKLAQEYHVPKFDDISQRQDISGFHHFLDLTAELDPD